MSLSSGDRDSPSSPNERTSINVQDSNSRSESNSQRADDNVEYELALEMMDTDSQDENYEPEGNGKL